MRARAQRLTTPANKNATPASVLRDVLGLQAQVMTAAALGIRARSHGLHIADVSDALNQDRSIVRSWLMRGTLHLIAAEDLGWMLGLLGPVFAGKNGKRHAQLGLDADLKARGVTAIQRILSDAGPLTRYQIIDRLGRRGIRLDKKTQAPIHLIQFAALRGVLCLGPDRPTGETTYVLIEDWIGSTAAPSPSGEQVLAELARRYFGAYGPATIEDLAAWSGLPISLARFGATAARARLAQVTIRRESAFLPKGQLAGAGERRLTTASVRLLPAFDTYLLGYASRSLAVPSALERRLQRGGGWLHPAVVMDGHAIAGWTPRRAGERGDIAVDPAGRINRAIRSAIEDEARDIGRFLGLARTDLNLMAAS